MTRNYAVVITFLFLLISNIKVQDWIVLCDQTTFISFKRTGEKNPEEGETKDDSEMCLGRRVITFIFPHQKGIFQKSISHTIPVFMSRLLMC